MISAVSGPRFGFWAPVYGSWGIQHDPENPPDSSYARNRQLLRDAEEFGFDSTLLAEMIINPNLPGFDVLETWTAAAALAEATERLEIIAAIKPLLFHPGVLAKMATTIDHISNGRFAINLVSGWYTTEMAQLGISMPPHDERYGYSEEWITIVKSLWGGGPVGFQGKHFSVDGLELMPRPVRSAGPTVYFGGDSDVARTLAAKVADVFFMNGRSIEDTAAVVADLRSRPRAGEPLRFGLSAFVITRETSDEVVAEQARLTALTGLNDRSHMIAGADPEGTIAKTQARMSASQVGTAGGTLAGLVGTYDEVAERIDAFAEVGIELFMLQFHPFESEIRRFGEEVIPRVRASARVRA